MGEFRGPLEFVEDPTATKVEEENHPCFQTTIVVEGKGSAVSIPFHRFVWKEILSRHGHSCLPPWSESWSCWRQMDVL